MADSREQEPDERLEALQRENERLRGELQAIKSRVSTGDLDTEARLAELELELSLVREVSSAIVSQLELPRVLELVAEKALQILDAESVLIPLINPARSEYRYEAAAGQHAGTIVGTHFPIHVGMCGWVLTNEQPLLYGEDSLFSMNESTRWEQGQTSAVLVPLRGREHIIGGLSALGKKGGGSFTTADLDVLTLFANQVSVAIENASLFAQLQTSMSTLELRVRERTSELTAINRELESFCYSASHDLRTPLRSIDGFSQFLQDEYSELFDETARGYLDRIRAGSRRMGEVIDDLLKLSKVTRHALKREAIDLSEMANAIIADLAEGEPERIVYCEVDPELHGRGDRNLLRLALENLISNAWKYTGKQADARIRLGQEEINGESVFHVRDNGVGFNMDYRNKLFRPFHRLHADTEFPGSGIGLAIVHRIIDRHGGRIWAESSPGTGATFYFTLTGGPDGPPAD